MLRIFTLVLALLVSPFDCDARPDCKLAQLGTRYTGTLNVTVTGKTCQAWTAQHPHEHNQIENFRYPDGSAAEARNYCRNPDFDPVGPWCYTTDPAVRWDKCRVPLCNDVVAPCKKTPTGAEYRGTLNVTTSGRFCQAWTSQYPHQHDWAASRYPDGGPAAASNYCRNLDCEGYGPWCYTTDPRVRWEECDVQFCPGVETTTRPAEHESEGEYGAYGYHDIDSAID